MKGSAWNLATVTLLGLIATGVFTIPRFNYQALVARQVAVEVRQNQVEEKLSKINFLSGGNREDRRFALVSMLDTLPGLIAGLDNAVTALREEQSNLLRRTVDLSQRLEQVEQHPIDSAAADAASKPAGPSTIGMEMASYYTEPIALPEPLKTKADAISARGASQWQFEDLLRYAFEIGLLPSASADSLTPVALQDVQRAFSIYKCTIDLINFEETLHVRQLVEEASAKGDYSDVPYEPGEEQIKQPVKVDRAVQFIKKLPERSVRRYFKFPLDDYPEFAHFTSLRDNARDHFVRDIALLGQQTGLNGDTSPKH